MKKVILHLCADIGSDSRFFSLDPDFEVIKVGESIGVENFNYDGEVYGVIANPVCTKFSNVNQHRAKIKDEDGLFLVKHCLRIIKEVNPKWWVLENPANGTLKKYLGKPKAIYQPWQYGSPWTKATALWGKFKMPIPKYTAWHEVPNKLDLWTRKGRKPSIVWWHKSAVGSIPEFDWAKDLIKNDMDLRSMCSQGFAKAFYESNKGE